MSDVIYFELNNWFAGRDYPDAEPFLSWLGNDSQLKFLNEDWVKENKLCVSTNNIDMSTTFRITAPKEWVEKNCPELLTKYNKFVKVEDENGDVVDRFGYPFLCYYNKNIGIDWVEEGDE